VTLALLDLSQRMPMSIYRTYGRTT